METPVKQEIAFIGTESLFAELRMDVVMDRVLLNLDLIEYSHTTGRFVRWDIGHSDVEDEYAVDEASNLESVAMRALEDRGVHGWRDGGRDFAAAVEAELERLRDLAPVAAE